MYAVVADASIGGLFMGGVLPGLVVAGLFSLYCLLRSARDAGPNRPTRAGAAEILSALRRAIWPLTLPPLILGGMYMGVFTATEGAAVGAIAALMITALAYRALTWSGLYEAALEAARLSAVLFLILVAAAMFGHVLVLMRLPTQLAESVTAMGLGPTGFVLVVMGVVFLLGMFLEAISIILVTTPIVLPVLEALDVNLIWYGVLLMVNLELAMITPPVGMNLFVIKSIARAPLREIMMGALPYVALMLAGLAVVFAFPNLVLWLPGTMGFH